MKSGNAYRKLVLDNFSFLRFSCVYLRFNYTERVVDDGAARVEFPTLVYEADAPATRPAYVLSGAAFVQLPKK